MSVDDRVRRVCATYRSQRRMGGRCYEHALATLVHAPERPDVWDANCACDVRATTPDEIVEVLSELDARMGRSVRVRKFFCDPLTPQPFLAALCVRGFAREATVQLVLEGALRARPRKVDIRRAESDEDWDSLARMTELDVSESLEKSGHGAPGADFLRQFVAFRRDQSREMHMWIAREADKDCGYFGSWSGVDGMGMVEWLFCRRDHRRRGVATALIAHAVADARERGAGPVLIGASAGPDAVPRQLYASLGFRPVCLTEEHMRLL